MFAKKIIHGAAALSLAFGGITAQAQDNGALLDLLVRKKIITDQEAEDIGGELTKDYAATPAGKLKMSTPLTELELYGDGRVRYEVRNGNSGAPGTLVANPNDTQQRNRARYRLRLGLRGTLADDFFFGLRLETSASPRSTNVTFGDDAGPFGKTSDGEFVGQAYVSYRGLRDITLTAGRMPNPFVTSSMVWDGDINPEGLAQQYKHTFNLSFGGGSAATADSSSKDGKGAVEAISEPYKMSIDVFANFGQFVYDDNNPENPIGDPVLSGGRRVPENDAYLLGYQVGARFKLPDNLYFQIAPTLYHYTGYGNDFNTFFSGDPNFRDNNLPPVTITPNQAGINSLLVFDMPAEFGFKIGELPARIFGDFAVNLDAADRATAAGHPDKDDQRYAYQIGLGLGQLKAKRDWQIQAFWQHAEQYALDPNLVDSDIFDSRVNMEGVAIQAGYAITDAVTFNVTYAYGEQIDHALGTGGVGDIGVNPLRQYQLFQADLSFKF
ncbi:MAG TPA: putative porin [Chthoniobacterales bacterium]|nr:putative porin [Chthoniobacterales bacterium]